MIYNRRTVTLRAFSQDDWAGFAGAEEFENGDRPQIADWKARDCQVLMVVSKGLSTVFFYENGEPMDAPSDSGGWMLENSFKSAAEARDWFNAVRPLLGSKRQILALGFSD